MLLILLFLAVLLLTYSNGANDNFKGVATLWGSGTLAYRPALILATVATFAGSICSYFFAEELIKNFSGKGLVPDDIIQSVDFILAVALAAGVTVLLATKLGFPISTTHGLVGALVGAGLVAVGTAVNFSKLGTTFFLPLVLGPVLAVGLGSLVYVVFRQGRKAAGITEESCVCVGDTWVPVASAPTSAFTALPTLQAGVGSQAECQNLYQGKFIGLNFQPLINNLHYFSAAAVSFARGLNDTPKLVGLLLVCKFFQMPVNVLILASAMAVGGWLNARRVADTMSKKISKLNHGQGFTANMVTSLLVIAASKFGLPVSTTHVSVGSIYGIGLVNKTANSKEIAKIGLSWLLTLPVAALLSAGFYFTLHALSH
ncbi:anion permease [Hymenobacter sp. BT770]|uniref:inorganic phosphate transporter n=1 Tax=Hymenobacter sp. BT770 TaxID=2886942 RepID=UPI001D10AC07|nr:inorganic phosphate transporter [Hymenobacter sp. BT770]MCC3154467.1 inorganic phosphate transporter [Hymenobacter sp. BT770]MDO3416468.1 anion permease [Hymenobacter sp. BT770]